MAKLLIGAKYVQTFLQNGGYYQAKIDGIFGRLSQRASKVCLRSKYSNNFSSRRTPLAIRIGIVQEVLRNDDLYKDTVDGFLGPNTLYAVELWQDRMRSIDAPLVLNESKLEWPKYRYIESFYGMPGTGIRSFETPYPLHIAWDPTSTRSHLNLHEKCGESAIRVMRKVLSAYGHSGISELRLDMFGGDYNKRTMRGGKRWSTHAYGCAIDFDPSHNQFRWSDTKASFDAKVYDKWWSLWEEEGWVSLGRERNFDWMHVQACRL